jgi:hypothetical protein
MHGVGTAATGLAGVWVDTACTAQDSAGDRRHANDARAASDERDKLPNTLIKSVCRGC